jgi:hypothetical protein
MDDTSRDQTVAGACPHVNRNDLRCATRFSLGRIDQAFSVCFGAFHGCPMYHRINAEHTRQAHTEPPTVAVTIRRHAIPLRATGT